MPPKRIDPTSDESRSRSAQDEQNDVDRDAADREVIYDRVILGRRQIYLQDLPQAERQKIQQALNTVQAHAQNLHDVADADREMDDLNASGGMTWVLNGPLGTQPKAIRRGRAISFMAVFGVLGLAVGVGGTLLTLYLAKLLWAADQKAEENNPTPPPKRSGIDEAYKILEAWLAFPDDQFWAAFKDLAVKEAMSITLIDYVALFLRAVVERATPADQRLTTVTIPNLAAAAIEYQKWKGGAKGVDDIGALFDIVTAWPIPMNLLPNKAFPNPATERSIRLLMLRRLCESAIADAKGMQPPT